MEAKKKQLQELQSQKWSDMNLIYLSLKNY